MQMIDAAKYYIYIENQFFITIADDSVVKNQLAEALFRRVLRAHTSNEKFRVYIVLPLLPGFDNVNAVQAVLYFIMRSITKGEGSLFKRLEKAGVPVDDYISFYGMRAHDVLMGILVTEIIYVHSKLMIIDDRMAICGSANINDRSLLGQRDSEVGMVINDLEEEEGRLNGQTVRIGKFCSSWRKRLFA
jgi:phospholipase D1/2